MRAFALLTAVALAGCVSMNDPDEESGLRAGHDGNQTQQQTLALADELFDFDPTIDPTKTAQQNADAIFMRATTQLTCAMVMVSNTTITVTASAPCTGPNGTTFSGALSAEVAKSANTITVTLTFTNVTIGDAMLSGTVTLATINGTTFDVTYALTKSGTMTSGTLKATGAPGQITVSGELTTGTQTVSFSTVVWKKGDCYPSSGTVSVTQGRITTTYTFNAQTPSTGFVTTGRNRTAKLPAYGSCPRGDAGP